MWQRFGIGRKNHYELERLIDYRARSHGAEQSSEQIICDIDKTYLETEFDSWLQIARTALEDPEDKVTVIGAAEILMGMRWGGHQPVAQGNCEPRPLHFVSSSPLQMRGKLEEKMLLDGLDWTSDTFKNQAYNLLTGRPDLLRQHVAYKSAAILRIMSQGGESARFHLIGDSAESDAFTYFGVFLFAARLLSRAGYQKFLEIAGVDANLAKGLLKGYESEESLRTLGKVDSIAIRELTKHPITDHPALTQCLDRFQSFLELGFIFLERGLIEPRYLQKWLFVFNNRYSVSARSLYSLILSLRFAGTEGLGTETPPAEDSNALALAVAAAKARLEPVLAWTAPAEKGQGEGAKSESNVFDRRRQYSLVEAGERLAKLGESVILDECRLWFERSEQARRSK